MNGFKRGLRVLALMSVVAATASAQWVDPDMYQPVHLSDYELRGAVSSVKNVYQRAGEPALAWLPQAPKMIPDGLRPNLAHQFNYDLKFTESGVLAGEFVGTMNITRGGQGLSLQKDVCGGKLVIDADGFLRELENAATRYKVMYSYDEAGRLVEAFAAPPAREGTSYRYDEQGRRLEVYGTPLKKGEAKSRYIRLSTFSYNDAGDMVEAKTWDYSQSIKTGKVGSGRYSFGEGQCMYKYSYREMDDGGREVYREEYRSPLATESDSRSKWIYNANGDLVAHNNDTYEYNEKGERVRVTDTLNGTTIVTTYNEQGDVESNRYVGNVSTILTEYKYTYDSQGNWTSCRCSRDGVLQYIIDRAITYYPQ